MILLIICMYTAYIDFYTTCTYMCICGGWINLNINTKVGDPKLNGWSVSVAIGAGVIAFFPEPAFCLTETHMSSGRTVVQIGLGQI